MLRHIDRKTGFTLVELLVASTLLTIAATAVIPIIKNGRAQSELKQYAQELEMGLSNLRADLGMQKTSCEIKFAKEYSFKSPEDIVEFSKKKQSNSTSMMCCDSEIGRVINDLDCNLGYSGYQLNELDITPKRKNLRLSQHESTSASRAVKVAVTKTGFDLTPPGTIVNSETFTFLVCHRQSLLKNESDICIPNKKGLDIRCVHIDGAGETFSGVWKTSSSNQPVEMGWCKEG